MGNIMSTIEFSAIVKVEKLKFPRQMSQRSWKKKNAFWCLKGWLRPKIVFSFSGSIYKGKFLQQHPRPLLVWLPSLRENVPEEK